MLDMLKTSRFPPQSWMWVRSDPSQRGQTPDVRTGPSGRKQHSYISTNPIKRSIMSNPGISHHYFYFVSAVHCCPSKLKVLLTLNSWITSWLLLSTTRSRVRSASCRAWSGSALERLRPVKNSTISRAKDSDVIKNVTINSFFPLLLHSIL